MKRCFFATLLLMWSCQQAEPSKEVLPEKPKKLQKVAVEMPDTTRFAIMPPQAASAHRLPQSFKPAMLSAVELAAIDHMLQACVADFNTMQRQELSKRELAPYIDKKQFFIDLPRYKRQYVAVLNSRGEKEVWVNCFCSDETNWRTQIVDVDDGGNCFFNVTINLSKGIWHDMAANGTA
ncbi:hypothetical protein F0P96_03450 [Hymenobacter busanensis]|uniref:Uncharacterized protein n=1 Tax=Hymenobacter busanensis TaxID=2607656 RepID=A0A7L4ZWI3_9BACT|nr:hypothetical protein [Hymenobacter busanensis]KAA9339683.1 hypothetical protein F0P96_03450 [Hymenobacter busanensis]QHJ06562.1 hypothetical protein GUY19_04300 [Hymenobacter busanensis]